MQWQDVINESEEYYRDEERKDFVEDLKAINVSESMDILNSVKITNN